MRHFLLIAVLFILFGCEKASTPLNHNQESTIITSHFCQIPGCQGHSNNLAKSLSNSNCFLYFWDDTLKLEFCVLANCCPDTNRFDFNSVIEGNIISVTVIDTAAHLCYCICNYRLHLDFTGLSKEEYIFKCSYYDSLVYSEKIAKP